MNAKLTYCHIDMKVRSAREFVQLVQMQAARKGYGSSDFIFFFLSFKCQWALAK